MGLLWWRKGNNNSQPEVKSPPSTSTEKPKNAGGTGKSPAEVPGMNGAMEVPRPLNTNVSVFEFGSVATSNDKVTLAGYCPVSEDLEPCRWEILPAVESNAPQFRVVF